MTTIQILYETDHKNRADALMTSLANTAVSDHVDKPPVKIAGLERLIFWGHGDKSSLCHKSARQILDIIKAWRALNDSMTTIEILTCNSRHFTDHANGEVKPEKYLKSILTHLGSDKRVDNSMAKQIKRGLKYSIYPSIRKLKVLSMPQSVRGGHNQWSILYWDGNTNSWCYVTGPTEKDMFRIGTNIKQKKKNPPVADQVWGGPRTGDFPTKLAAAQIEFPSVDDYRDVRAGDLTTLRNVLVEIN